MEEKPHRSWGKTFNQLWIMAMCDPINKQVTQGLSNNVNSGPNNQKDWRDRCCWRFNRGAHCRNNCKFDHRCKVCRGYSHGANSCNKKKNNQDFKSGSIITPRIPSPQVSPKKSK